jgi:hypothetical protein
VITAISGCNFAECYIKRIDSEMDGVPVSVIGRDDLIKNKLKAGRLKDLQDVQKLT